MRVAVIDIGTNTTRLLVVEVAGRRIRELDRRLAFTRLGEGLDSSGLLSEESMRRTLRAVGEYCAVAGELDAIRLKIAGTSAMRDAQNSQAFLDAIERLSGVTPSVLTGPEEARLSFLGATSELDQGLYLVCDIGGGSTELVLGQVGSEPEEKISLDIGSVRLTERHLLSDPPATEEILTMEGAVDDALVAVDRVIPRAGMAKLVGVAGTVTTLAAIHLGLEAYEPSATHLLSMERTAVDSAYRQLAHLTLQQRLAIPALPEGRADVIVAGASILSRIMARWAFGRLVVSEKDILDGLVLESLEEENR